MIKKGSDLREPLRTRADVCVIGSGAGGAVVAKELAEAGFDVVLLEQGGYYTKDDFSQREEEMLPILYEDAGQRTTKDQSITILQGRNVGGSTVHNLCYCFPPPDPILRLWRTDFGVRDLSTESLRPSVQRVEQTLKVKPIKPSEVNPLNRLVEKGCRELGYHGFYTRHNRENCVLSGYCMLGCAYDAKQSMLITYVPLASSAGARIYADCRVERIVAEGGRVRGIIGTVADEDGRPRFPCEVEASIVVLSAGAINSPQVLLQSGLANDYDQVGQNLHLHPIVVSTGIFEKDLHTYYGIPQSYFVDEFIDLEKDPYSGYVLMPIVGFPILTAANLAGFGETHYGQMKDFPKMAGLLVLLHDQSYGRVKVEPDGRPQIDYRVSQSELEKFKEGVRHSAEILLAAGAKRVLVPYNDEPLYLEAGGGFAELERRGIVQGEMPIISTHPQSTCRMGEDPRSSVVNSWCEAHGVKGLFVCDTSVFPTSIGYSPQITTAALADRTAHHIIGRRTELLAKSY